VNKVADNLVGNETEEIFNLFEVVFNEYNKDLKDNKVNFLVCAKRGKVEIHFSTTKMNRYMPPEPERENPVWPPNVFGKQCSRQSYSYVFMIDVERQTFRLTLIFGARERCPETFNNMNRIVERIGPEIMAKAKVPTIQIGRLSAYKRKDPPSLLNAGDGGNIIFTGEKIEHFDREAIENNKADYKKRIKEEIGKFLKL
jgi:hypothetical protein